MAYKNSAVVYIDGINRTANAVMPVNWGDFLDERLDELSLSLRAIKKENFAPLTPVEIIFDNELYFGRGSSRRTVSRQKSTKHYIIANDTVSESRLGSGFYNHELYLIEVTKAAECCIVDTVAFTNDIGRIYTQNQSNAQIVNYSNGNGRYQGWITDFNVFSPISKPYVTPADARNVTRLPFELVMNKIPVDTNIEHHGSVGTSYERGFAARNYIYVYRRSDYHRRDSITTVEGTLQPSGEPIKPFKGFENGQPYVIEYISCSVFIQMTFYGEQLLNTTEELVYASIKTFDFVCIENKRPLKKWTITDVINRTLDIAEPIRRGEKPRFRLNEEQAEKFDKILAPQFSFTKQTLRECLQEIGKVIHGEPRFKIKKGSILKKEYFKIENFTNGEAYIGSNSWEPYEDNKEYYVLLDGIFRKATIESVADETSPANDDYYLIIENSDFTGDAEVYAEISIDDYYYEVSYDMYASQEKSGIYTLPYKLKTVSQVIDSYTAWLDSNAENLVNQLDKFSGVIVEPYDGGAKTVRTESMYVRINDDNMHIPTQYPIYTVDKLEYVYTDNGEVKSLNITPWLFEQSIYNTQLSSYAEQYPYSKAYGLYYTQGSKNIGGLNFKVDSAAFADFKDYAIVNVIRQASGNNSLPIAKEEFEGAKYPNMCFRVTYTPFYNVRVAQTKPYYKDFKRPAALIYNQQSNIVESRYYGENLKGAIARLGNIELSLTYRLYRLSDIPKAGQMYDENYYISAVAVEYLPTCIKCTIGLSKDFNRLSAYIGINSEKRFYEVSQNQAVERNTLWREYIVIGKQETPDSTALIGSNMLSAIADTFTQSGELKQITCVTAWGTSFKGADLNAVNLPVISSAFGNSISFSWAYEDNYSAGAVSRYTYVDEGPKGYFQNNYPYADYYGRIYYYNFDLRLADDTPTADNLAEKGRELPGATKATSSSGYVSTVGKTPYILRKDNREILQCNFQIDFVTNLENFIIGSALASYCPAVRGSDSSLRARLYVFDTELNKFTDHVEAFENVNLSVMDSAEVSVTMGNGYFTVNAEAFPKTETGSVKGKSWAIITQQTITSTEEVEDEQGSVSTQSNVYGGDLLIGQNIEVTSGQAFTPIYFTKKRDIFDRTVWKDIR